MSPAVVKRPLWSIFIPSSYSSKVRQLAFHAPTLLFGVAATAIVMKQSFYRNKLANEDPKTCDRIDRRAYVRLPDGRNALVYPVVDTQLTPMRVILSYLDMINPLP